MESAVCNSSPSSQSPNVNHLDGTFRQSPSSRLGMFESTRFTTFNPLRKMLPTRFYLVLGCSLYFRGFTVWCGANVVSKINWYSCHIDRNRESKLQNLDTSERVQKMTSFMRAASCDKPLHQHPRSTAGFYLFPLAAPPLPPLAPAAPPGGKILEWGSGDMGGPLDVGRVSSWHHVLFQVLLAAELRTFLSAKPSAGRKHTETMHVALRLRLCMLHRSIDW